MRKILITGGAGFIGSALVRKLVKNKKYNILNLDKVSYASMIKYQPFLKITKNNYQFKKIDITSNKLCEIINEFKPDTIFHLAAESHVDNSINNSEVFINSNIIGTYKLLEIVRNFWNKKNFIKKNKCRFIHISTDEVYGFLKSGEKKFSETSRYQPSSPYSASKASSDHLVKAWHITYGMPTLITNCTNNFGPFQYNEKLIPMVILNALKNKTIPVYGDGKQVRDWIYVDDHVNALIKVAERGVIGESYNIGCNNEISNIDLIIKICKIIEKINFKANNNNYNYKKLIKFVKDRPGHDFRYALDNNKIKKNLNWDPTNNFNQNLKLTIEWYIYNFHQF